MNPQEIPWALFLGFVLAYKASCMEAVALILLLKHTCEALFL